MSNTTRKPFPGFERIYAFSDAGTNHFWGRVVLPLTVKTIPFLLGEEDPPWYVPIYWGGGRKIPSDVVCAGVEVIAIHERVRRLLLEHGFTGWKTYPVHVAGPEGDYEDYHGLAVTGRCGPLDYTRSIPFQKQMPGGVFPYWRGEYFDETTWDGSDLFIPQGTLHIFVVEEVKQAFERAKVRNVSFTRLTEREVSESTLRLLKKPIPERRDT